MIYSSRGIYIPYTNICVHLCAFKSMFASERVHMGMQLHAPQLRFMMVFGVWHTEGGNSFRFGPRQRRVSLVTPKLLQTLDGGSDNLQSEWAATEGDSVKWWKRAGPYISQ